MSYLLSPVFQGPQLDNNGNLLVGGKLYWYLAGTTTPVTVYQDASGGAAFTQPIILDSRGESAAPIYLQTGQAYKAVLQDASGAQLNVIDNIQGVNDVAFTAGSLASLIIDSTGNGALLYQGASGDLEIQTNQVSGTAAIYKFRNDLFQTPLGLAVDASGNVTASGGSLTATGGLTVSGDVTYGTGSLTSAGGLVTSKGSLTADGLTFGDTTVQPTAQFTGFRNRLHNGDFRVAQRGTSGTVANAVTLDRWITSYGGPAPTWAQVGSLTFDGSNTNLALEVTYAAGTTGVNFQQRIESLNSIDLAAQNASFSTWLYQDSGSTQTATIYLSYPNATDNWSGSLAFQTIAASIPTGTWTKVTGTYPMNALVERGLGFQVVFGNLGTGKKCRIGKTQLESGPAVTPLERRPYGVELALCQRYYQSLAGLSGFFAGTTSSRLSAVLPVAMRAAPSVSASAALILTDSGADYTQSAANAVLFDASTQSVSFNASNLTGVTAYRPCHMKTSGGSILLSAEL